MRSRVSRSKIFRAAAWILPGGVSVVLAVLAFPAAASSTHGRGHKDGGITVSKAPYGTLGDGTAVDQYTLANQHGMTVKIITYGGIVTEMDTPDRKGKTANVALGFDSLDEYLGTDRDPRLKQDLAKGYFTDRKLAPTSGP